jgi:hypothetical protein
MEAYKSREQQEKGPVLKPERKRLQFGEVQTLVFANVEKVFRRRLCLRIINIQVKRNRYAIKMH